MNFFILITLIVKGLAVYYTGKKANNVGAIGTKERYAI